MSQPAKPRKRRCPKCLAPATDIGTCPYCHTLIGIKGETVHYTYLGKYLNFSYILKPNKNQLKRKTKYKIVKKKGFHRGEITRILPADNSFFTKIPNKNYSIDSSIQLRLKDEINEEESVLVGKGGRTSGLHFVERNVSCECGCEICAVDYDRGEIFCPECGLVQDSQLFIESLEESS